MADIGNLIKKYEPQFADFLKSRVSAIDLEIQQKVGHLLKEKKELMEALSEMNMNGKASALSEKSTSGLEIKEYRTDMATIEKALFFTAFEYLTIHEIAIKIHKSEPHLNLSDIKNNLSAVLAMDVKNKKPRMDRKKNANNKWIYMAK